MAVLVAVALSVGTHSVQLYVQRPRLGLIDGVRVCACPKVCDRVCEGLCGYMCQWHPLYTGKHTVMINDLCPGSQYQLTVSSTSGQRMGTPYYTHPFKTRTLHPMFSLYIPKCFIFC